MKFLRFLNVSNFGCCSNVPGCIFYWCYNAAGRCKTWFYLFQLPKVGLWSVKTVRDLPLISVMKCLMAYSFLFNTSHSVIRDTATLLALHFCHFFVHPHESRYRTRTNQSKKPLEFGSKLVQYLLRKLPWLQLERKIRHDLYWRGESIWWLIILWWRFSNVVAMVWGFLTETTPLTIDPLIQAGSQAGLGRICWQSQRCWGYWKL